MSPPVLKGGSCYDLRDTCFVWHSSNVAKQAEKCRAWTIAERCGCPVVCLTSSFVYLLGYSVIVI